MSHIIAHIQLEPASKCPRTHIAMNGVFTFCAHVGRTRPRQPPEDGEMNEMTPPSRHRIKNSEAEHTTSRSPS